MTQSDVKVIDSLFDASQQCLIVIAFFVAVYVTIYAFSKWVTKKIKKKMKRQLEESLIINNNTKSQLNKNHIVSYKIAQDLSDLNVDSSTICKLNGVDIAQQFEQIFYDIRDMYIYSTPDKYEECDRLLTKALMLNNRYLHTLSESDMEIFHKIIK